MSSTFCGAVNFWVAEGGSEGQKVGAATSTYPLLLPGPPAHFTEGKARSRQHPPLLWATTSQMASESEMLGWLNWPRGCSSVKVDWVSLPPRVVLESWGT